MRSLTINLGVNTIGREFIKRGIPVDSVDVENNEFTRGFGSRKETPYDIVVGADFIPTVKMINESKVVVIECPSTAITDGCRTILNHDKIYSEFMIDGKKSNSYFSSSRRYIVFSNHKSFEVNYPVMEYRETGEILRQPYNKCTYIPHSEKQIELLRKIEQGGNIYSLTPEEQEIYQKGSSVLRSKVRMAHRLNMNDYCPSLPRNISSRLIECIHPTKNRMLSVEESALMLGIKDFQNYHSRTRSYVVLSKCCPTQVAKILVDTIVSGV